jgi:hypothetical protein
MTMAQIAEATARTARELSGVLGGLGNRINRTPGSEDQDATAAGLGFRRIGNQWWYSMRPVLREALEVERLV